MIYVMIRRRGLLVPFALAACVALAACAKKKDDGDAPVAEVPDAGGDETPPKKASAIVADGAAATVTIEGAEISVPAGALAVGATVEAEVVAAPAEFTAAGVEALVSEAVELRAVDANGQVIVEAAQPMTIALKLGADGMALTQDPAALPAELCVLATVPATASSALLKLVWTGQMLTVDQASGKVTIASKYFGTYAVARCAQTVLASFQKYGSNDVKAPVAESLGAGLGALDKQFGGGTGFATGGQTPVCLTGRPCTRTTALPQGGGFAVASVVGTKPLAKAQVAIFPANGAAPNVVLLGAKDVGDADVAVEEVLAIWAVQENDPSWLGFMVAARVGGNAVGLWKVSSAGALQTAYDTDGYKVVYPSLLTPSVIAVDVVNGGRLWLVGLGSGNLVTECIRMDGIQCGMALEPLGDGNTFEPYDAVYSGTQSTGTLVISGTALISPNDKTCGSIRIATLINGTQDPSVNFVASQTTTGNDAVEGRALALAGSGVVLQTGSTTTAAGKRLGVWAVDFVEGYYLGDGAPVFAGTQAGDELPMAASMQAGTDLFVVSKLSNATSATRLSRFTVSGSNVTARTSFGVSGSATFKAAECDSLHRPAAAGMVAGCVSSGKLGIASFSGLTP